MRTLEELLDQIPKYLSRRLPPNDLAEFEAALKTYPILKRETEELAELQKGMMLADAYDDGHLDHDLIINSVYSPQALSEDEKKRLVKHTDSCQRCRQDVDFVEQSYQALDASTPNPLTNHLKRLNVVWDAFRPHFRPALGPALAAIVVLLLAIPAFYGIQNYWSGDDSILTYRVQQLGTRAGVEIETVVIQASDKLLRLEVLVPVQDQCTYSFALINATNEAVITVQGLQPAEPMVVEIPAIYVPTGEYTLVFEESQVGKTEAILLSKVTLKIIHQQ